MVLTDVDRAGHSVHIIIQAADLAPGGQIARAALRPERIEAIARQRMAGLDVGVEFDWTAFRRDALIVCSVFDSIGRPLRAPEWPRDLPSRLERAVREAIALAPTATALPQNRAQRWHARAEEYRVMAENAASVDARAAFAALADNCSNIAARMDRVARAPGPIQVSPVNSGA